MMKSLLAIFACLTFGMSANAKPLSTDTVSFCKNKSQESTDFDDDKGVSTMAERQGKIIKVNRAMRSADLGWTVYDGYAFSSTDGSRIEFSRSVVYAANIMSFTKIVHGKGKAIDNMNVLPDGFEVPSVPELSKLADFCKLPAKSKEK